MPEANPKDRRLADEPADRFHQIFHGRGVARTIGEKNTVGFIREDLFGRCVRRNYLDLKTMLVEFPVNIPFLAAIHGHDLELFFLSIPQANSAGMISSNSKGF